MKPLAFLLFIIAFVQTSFAQIDNQIRLTSNHRTYYQWNEERNDYLVLDNEYESSVIDIREINTNRNGYIVISLTDDGVTRLYHGSIKGYSNENGIETWSMRSKVLKSKLVYDKEKKQVSYSYEATDQRYNKIFVFDLSEPNN